MTGKLISLLQSKKNIQNNNTSESGIFLITGDSTVEDTFTELTEVMSANGDKGIDLLFIDGAHKYEAVKRDFETYSKIIRPHGFIVFDDGNWASVYEVMREIEEFNKEYEFVGSINYRVIFMKKAFGPKLSNK